MSVFNFLKQLGDNTATNARYSLPDCIQSWIALLVYLACGLIISVALVVFPFDVAKNQLLTYVITIIPPFIYLLFVGKRRKFEEVSIVDANN